MTYYWRTMKNFINTLCTLFLTFATLLLANFAQGIDLLQDDNDSNSSSKRVCKYGQHWAKHTKCGAVPYPSNTGNVTPDPILDSPQVWSFISESNLHPMKVTVNTHKPGTSPGFVFLVPYAFSSNA